MKTSSLYLPGTIVKPLIRQLLYFSRPGTVPMAMWTQQHSHLQLLQEELCHWFQMQDRMVPDHLLQTPVISRFWWCMMCSNSEKPSVWGILGVVIQWSNPQAMGNSFCRMMLSDTNRETWRDPNHKDANIYRSLLGLDHRGRDVMVCRCVQNFATLWE